MFVVDLNNDLKKLEIDEEKGIIKLWCEEYNEVVWNLKNISSVEIL